MQVNLFDSNFSHSLHENGYVTSSYNRKPKKISWILNQKNYNGGITIFTDAYIVTPIVDNVNSRIKIAWLIEPPTIHPLPYQFIEKYENKFDYIFTYDENLLKKSPKYQKIVIGSVRIPNKDIKIYSKTKLLSIIASNKKQTTGHQLRHEIIKRIKSKVDIDLWGSGYKKFDSKLDPLKDYCFSIAIMNTKMNNFFTEVLTDCFAVGTVPIFWGCPNIHEYFNIDGILTFDCMDELTDILENLSKEKYEKMLPAIQDNFERVKKYVSTDDMVADKLKDLF